MSVDQCAEVFGSEKLAILSNSAGSKDDKNYKDAILIESTLGLKVIRHPKTKKPDVWEDMEEHF